jgi:hypothetical protein
MAERRSPWLERARRRAERVKIEQAQRTEASHAELASGNE